MSAIIDEKVHRHRINAHWGGRVETSEALAERWLTLVAQLEVIEPAFSDWFHWDSELDKAIPFNSSSDAQRARVIAAIPTRPDGTPVFGCLLSIYNTSGFSDCPNKRSRMVSIGLSAGADGEWNTNSASLSSDPTAALDSEIATYRVFRAATLAFAETFEAAQAFSYRSDLNDLWPRPIPDSGIRLAWITYVAPRFADRVVPPPAAIAEYRPDGGLLLAATTEPFSIDNPVHLATARDIVSALEPIAESWAAEFQTRGYPPPS